MGPGIKVTSVKDGEVFTYPLAIIRGTINTNSAEVFVSTSVSTELGSVRYPVRDNRFTVQYYMKTGKNEINISYRECLTDPFTIVLVYQPPSLKLPHVRLIYLLTSDSDGSFQAPDKEKSEHNEGLRRLRTAGLMIQSATAEMLNAQGLGRRTFRLCEQIITHRLNSLTTKNAHETDGYTLWNITTDSLNKLKNRDDFIDIAVMSFTRFKDKAPRAHTALGGGFLALFGGGNLFTWPSSTTDIPSTLLDSRPFDRTRLFDDSGGRGQSHGRRACTATTIGALLHELGHCLSLPHPCANANAFGGGIMSRGFDFFDRLFIQPQGNSPEPFWDRGSAVRLRFHRFMQSDEEFLAQKMTLHSSLGVSELMPTSIADEDQVEPIASAEPEALHTPEEVFKEDMNDSSITNSQPSTGYESKTIQSTFLPSLSKNMDSTPANFGEIEPLLFEKAADATIHCRSLRGLGHLGYYCNGDNAAHEEFLDVHPKDFVLPHLTEIQRRCEARKSDTISLSAIDIDGNIEEIKYNEVL